MKKFCFILLAFFVLSLTTVQAQRFRAGLTAAATVTDIAGSDTRDNANDFNKLGFAVGGIVNTTINKNTFQLEINYIQKGSVQRPDSANNGYFKLAFDYIEVPLIFRRRLNFTLFKKTSSRFDLEGGVSVGRLMRTVIVGNDNYLQVIDPKNFNKTDISILVGIDYNITSNIYFCFRYSNSVIPVTKKNTAPGPMLVYLPATFNQGNNMVFQFAFKFIFGAAATKELPNE